MRMTCAFVLRSACAAARPPKPPPTMTTRGMESGMVALDRDSPGRKLDSQPEERKQGRKRPRHPHDDAGESLIDARGIYSLDHGVRERQDPGKRQALEHRHGPGRKKLSPRQD